MADYSKGKIYKLIAGDLVYYGSTVRPLNDRFSKHKSTMVCSSKKLFESGEEVKIELVEDYPCETEEELKKRESYYQLNYECVNERIARRTDKQYYEDNKEAIAVYHKQYHKDNKEYRNARANKKIQCECGCMVSRANIVRHCNSKKHKDLIDT